MLVKVRTNLKLLDGVERMHSVGAIIKVKTFVTFFSIAKRRFKSLYLSQFRRNMSDLPRCNYFAIVSSCSHSTMFANVN